MCVVVKGSSPQGVHIMWLRRSWSSAPVLSVALVSVALMALTSGGCADKSKSPGVKLPPPSAQDAAAVRERFLRANPQARVGIVAAVAPRTNLAAVGDVPLQDFAIGDVVTFIDAEEHPFNTGTVVNASSQYLHVRYETDRRAPRVGELAVHIRER
jgi:hypothetical protein